VLRALLRNTLAERDAARAQRDHAIEQIERLRQLCSSNKSASVALPSAPSKSQADHHALAGRHVGEHLGEEILHHLEGGDRLAELQPLLGVSL
jgi:hypothetical protein